MTGREILRLPDAAAWERWLESHGSSSPGVRLAIAKKNGGGSSPTYGESLDIALCFGWIDGQKGRLDDAFYLQLFTPRTARSIWSQRNREHIDRLTAAGRMRPAGLEQVSRAQADGRWAAAYAGQRTAAVPDDLLAALAATPEAETRFLTLDAANRYAILFRIGTVKRAETRQRKIADFVAMLARGDQLPHAPKPTRQDDGGTESGADGRQEGEVP